MISPWLGIILVLTVLGFVMGGIKLYEKKYHPEPELPRKAVHVLMGCITLSFPWLFSEPWPVLLLGILAVGAMFTVRFMGSLKNSVGSVLYGVKRESLGEIYFPISVVILFCMANGDKILYSIPILMLTFADSTAALIGSSYGRKNLASEKEDPKSPEGTFVFFVVAFMSTLVPILLFTNIGRAETLLLSLIMGLLVALIEVISCNGNDNLLIPLLGYAFLVSHINLNVEKLKNSLIFITLLAIFAFYWNKRGSLSRLGVIGGLLITYIIIILGGWSWFFAPFALFITYSILPSLTEEEKKQVMDYHIVTSNIAVGLLWVWLAAVTQMKELFFYGFTCAFACHLGMNTYIRLNYFKKYTEGKSMIISFIKASAFILLPGVGLNYLNYGSMLNIKSILLYAVSLLISIFAVSKLKKYMHYEIVDAGSGWVNAGIAFVLSGFIMLIRYFN